MKKIILLTTLISLSLSLLYNCFTTSAWAGSSLKGWELSEKNTGLKGDYTKLKIIKPEDVGSLARKTLFVSKNNITISDKHIPYQVVVTGKGVIFERCRFQPTTTGKGSPLIRSQESRAIFRDCEMDFSKVPIEQAYMSIGITLCGEIYRCNIYGSSTGIYISNNKSKETSIAEGNYIHGLRFQRPAHVDGLTIRRCDGQGGMIIRNNRIITDVPATGALFIQAWAGHINNVLIEGNLLQGYGHCLGLESNKHGYGKNMRAINNRLDAWTVQGAGPWYTTVAGGTSWSVWKDNYAYDAKAKDFKGQVVNLKKK